MVRCTFSYLLVLGIVTVHVRTVLRDTKLSGEVLQTTNILSHIYEVKLSRSCLYSSMRKH